MIRPFHWFDSIGSTMTEAVRLAVAGCPHGTVVGADEQTAGQGRLGRAWHSERGSGLYVSIVLRPNTDTASIPVLTMSLGLAAASAISRVAGVNCDLRWPNDVLINGRKCCGILAQLHGTAVVAGIGVNMNQQEFPPELAGIATSMRIECGMPQCRDRLLAELLDAVDQHVALLETRGKQAIFELFTRASSYVAGRRVAVDTTEGSLLGITNGLDSGGFLKLRKDDGTETLILAGGVRPA